MGNSTFSTLKENTKQLPKKLPKKLPKQLRKRKFSTKFRKSESSKTDKPSKPSKPNKNQNDKGRETGEILKYYLPNVEKDTDIMVILHFLGCYLFQSPYSAPIDEGKFNQEDFKVLDAGCGAGTWLLELATNYRLPKFYGFDLCPIYPAEIKPDNVEFMQHDILKGFPYEDNTFDYVHQGNLVCTFTLDEWKFAVSELVRVCKPGGYIEFTEPELATNTGPILTRFYDALLEHSESRDVKIRISKEIIKILESSPTVKNVEFNAPTVSLGYTKGGNAGQAYFEVHDGFFLNDPMPETMCQVMGLSVEDYLKLFDEAKEEVNQGIAPDCDIYRIWCQKV